MDDGTASREGYDAWKRRITKRDKIVNLVIGASATFFILCAAYGLYLIADFLWAASF